MGMKMNVRFLSAKRLSQRNVLSFERPSAGVSRGRGREKENTFRKRPARTNGIASQRGLNVKKIFTRILSAVLMTAFLLTTAACASRGGTDSTSAADDITNTAEVSYKAALTAQKISAFPDAFVSGMNQYGWTVASQLYDGENLSISPASLELAILMTRTGAIGATAGEMKTALSMSALSDEDILAACKQLMWRMNSNGLVAANSIWMQKEYPFSDTFINSCTNNFFSDAFIVDFMMDSPGATDSINSWASSITKGKIPKMNPEPLDPYTKLVLVNALYFLGDWKTPFTAEHNYDQTFHGTQKETTVTFMHDKRDMLYAETPSYQMVSLPFTGAEDKAESPYSMAFILPAQGQDVTALMNDLASTGFSSAIEGLAGTQVRLALPKFEFTVDISMVETMQSLGMNLAFSPEKDVAEFDGITGGPNDLSISDIIHKCYIRVDEKGAEAAAVTEPIMTSASASLDDDAKILTADRPFLFAIYDETDNSVLFLGVVGQI